MWPCSFIIKGNLVRIDCFAGSKIDGAEIQVQLARPPDENHWINNVLKNSYTDLKPPLGPKSVQTNIADIQSMSNNNIYDYEPQDLQQQVSPSQTEMNLCFDYELQSNEDLFHQNLLHDDTLPETQECFSLFPVFMTHKRN